jgi:hypothetical protein
MAFSAGTFGKAVPGLIGGIGSIWGGINNKRAIGQAGNAMLGGNLDAQGAVNTAVSGANQGISTAVNNATGWAGDAANYGSGMVTDAAQAAGQGVTSAATAAGQGVTDASGRAIAGVNTATGQANQYLDPYSTAGTGATQKLSDLASQQFQFSQDDPSYQWRLQQGQQALERSASAAGGVTGGGFAKSLTRYAQGAASTEYQAAFDRFLRNKAGSSDILSGLASRGLSAAGTQGAADIAAGRYAGDTGMGAAKYTGDIGFDASKYAGDRTYNAAQYGSDLGYKAATYGGDTGMQGANWQSQNTMKGGLTLADLLMGAGNIRAGTILGQAGAKNQIISGAGGVLSSIPGMFGYGG